MSPFKFCFSNPTFRHYIEDEARYAERAEEQGEKLALGSIPEDADPMAMEAAEEEAEVGRGAG